MIKDLSILAAVFIILKIINLPTEVNIVIIMIVTFGIFLKVYNETTEIQIPKVNYTNKSKWTQEDWDNWNPCSKENMEELRRNEFRLDENGNPRYKGDHL